MNSTQALADIYHQRRYNGQQHHHSPFHSCPCWHEAVATIERLAENGYLICGLDQANHNGCLATIEQPSDVDRDGTWIPAWVDDGDNTCVMIRADEDPQSLQPLYTVTPKEQL